MPPSSQQSNLPNPTTEPVGGEHDVPHSQNTKKRKPNDSGKKTTSVVWDHLTRSLESIDSIATCKHCGKRFRCDPKIQGTSNLLNHLKRVCPKYPFVAINDANQTSLTFKSGDNNSLLATPKKYNVKACRKEIAMFVIVDEQPFKVVEGEGLKILCRQLQPLFVVLSRFTIARDFFQLHMDERVRLKELFKLNCVREALTTDYWTLIQNIGYLTLTAHFIDNDWRYQKRIINFSVIPNHKVETIGRKVEEILREWRIRNVSTLTVDNASSNNVAVTYLKKKKG